MKNCILHLLCFLFLFSCRTDNIKSDFIETVSIDDNLNSEVSDTIKLKDVSQEEITKTVNNQEREAAKNDSLLREKSKINEVSCDDILEKYKGLIEDLESDIRNKEIQKKYREFVKEPKFHDCKKEVTLQKKFRDLDKRFLNLGSK